MRQSPHLTRRVRQLRRESTRAEVILWNALRGSALGARFRRQHPVAGFIADFCCPSRRIVIEIDGESHRWHGARDEVRELAIREHGFEVLRYAEREVYENLAAIVEGIARVVEERRATSS